MVKRTQKGILVSNNYPNNIPSNSQWLAGQGAGSWFQLKKCSHLNYTISRFSPEGELEFEATYRIKGDHEFCIDCPYAFTYLSHFKKCNILQHGEKYEFINISLQL